MVRFRNWWQSAALVVASAGIASLSGTPRASADAPSLVPIQGFLTASNGTPIDGDRSLAFGVYSAASGGAALYQETRTVTVAAGDFVVYLGEVTPLPLSLFRDQENLWLEVVIDGTDVVTPRTRLATGPYSGLAQYCEEASTLEGNDASDFALTVHTHSFTSLTSIPAGLADGDDDELGALACTSGQVAKRGASAWACGGDNDTLGGLSCTSGQLVQRGASAFACITPATVATTGSYNDLTNLPTGQLTGSGTANYPPRYTAATTLAASTVYQSGTSIGVGNTAPSVRLDVSGEVAWGTGTRPNRLGSTEGGSLELGDSSVASSKPFIDFHYGNAMSQDYDVRIGNDADGELRVRAAVLRVQGVSGGGTNIAMGHALNTITLGATSATIGGGGDSAGGAANSVTDSGGTVAGGVGNRAGNNTGDTIDTQYGTVAGGYHNVASGDRATVGGGDNNTASGGYATVGGGRSNLAQVLYATIAGGNGNTADGECFVGGGSGNSLSGASGRSVIGGGLNNVATDAWTSVIGGGFGNTATEFYNSVIGGGTTNDVNAFYSSVLAGGGNNTADEGYYSVIAGGSTNALQTNSSYSSIGGGSNNTITTNNSWVVVGGGFQNIGSGTGTTVAGGARNSAGGNYSAVPGGDSNSALGDYGFAAGFRAKANSAGCFAWGDSTAADVACNTTNAWVARTSGGATFYSNAGMTTGVRLAAGGGAWATVSDRALKQDIDPVDPVRVLDAVERMPVATWRYTSEVSRARHMGPMAQDFRAAFGLGDDDKSITTIDADGVALAAVQGLGERTKTQASELEALKHDQSALRADVESLRTQNAELLARLERLEARGGGSVGSAGRYSWLSWASTLLVGFALVVGYRQKERA